MGFELGDEASENSVGRRLTITVGEAAEMLGISRTSAHGCAARRTYVALGMIAALVGGGCGTDEATPVDEASVSQPADTADGRHETQDSTSVTSTSTATPTTTSTTTSTTIPIPTEEAREALRNALTRSAAAAPPIRVTTSSGFEMGSEALDIMMAMETDPAQPDQIREISSDGATYSVMLLGSVVAGKRNIRAV